MDAFADKRKTTERKKRFVFRMVDGERVAASSWQSACWKEVAEFKIAFDIFTISTSRLPTHLQTNSEGVLTTKSGFDENGANHSGS